MCILVYNYIPIYLKKVIDITIFRLKVCMVSGNAENGVGGKEMVCFFLNSINWSKCILMLSLYIWLSIFTNNETLRII